MKVLSPVLYQPAVIVLAFWLATYTTYIIGLFVDFPKKNLVELSVFLLANALAGLLGCIVALLTKVKYFPKDSYRKKALLGLFLYSLLFYPLVKVYTGNDILDFFNLLTSPLDAYNSMHNKVSEDRMDRAWVIIAKVFISPFLLISLPYFIMRVITYNKDKRYLFVLVLLYFSMSVMRGTDKELFDIFLIFLGSFLAIRPKFLIGLFSKKSNLKMFFLIMTIFSLVLASFSFKKEERLVALESRCFASTEICYDLNKNNNIDFAATLLSVYLTQGYYGLSLSFDADFNSLYGFGHSPSLLYIGQKFGMDISDSVVSQLDELGWASKGHWSTGFVSMANDVPFGVIPLIIFLVFFFMTLAYKIYLKEKDVLALTVFVYLFYTLIYMPANLQIAKSGDVYLGFLFLFFSFMVKLFRGNIKVKDNA
jgi:hypothetical protein